MNKENNRLSLEELEKTLLNIYNITDKPNRKIVIAQGCKTNGPVLRDMNNLNLCLDEECPSCTELKKILNKYEQK